MRIEEFPGEFGGGDGGEVLLPPMRCDGDGTAAKGEEEGGVVMRVAVDAKRAAVGVGARMLFYPTLVYNVVRNRFEAHFHWWDQVDEVRQSLPLLFLRSILFWMTGSSVCAGFGPVLWCSFWLWL